MESLRAFSHRTPFRPFVVEMVSGSRMMVEHPEAMAYQAGVAVYIAPTGALTLFDHEGVNQVTDVTAAEKE